MGLEARFSIQDVGTEIPFTIIEGENGQAFLYSQYLGQELRYPLTNEQGLLRLQNQNPFSESDEIVDERLTGLSSDYIETRSQGFENSTEFSHVSQSVYGPENIYVENKPFSLRQILELIENQDIELTPDFQRNFIWDKTRQSKLIESILLGLPLPSLYLSQYEDGRLTVVDGLQRLSTIKAFLSDDLKLTNLEYLKECNNKTYTQLTNILSPLRLRRFLQTQIMCFVIDYRSPSKLKFDLFRRLNTGGKPLNNQEIRNCLSRSEVQNVLKRMVALDSFNYATDWSVKDTRMDAREAALRFIYFSEQYTPLNPVGQYNGDMESTLDDFIDQINDREPSALEIYINNYNRGLRNSYRLFGRHCFRKVTRETLNGRRTAVNKLLMLSFTVLLSKYSCSAVEERYEVGELTQHLATLIDNDENLFRAITWGTNGKWNIDLAMTEFAEFIQLYLGDEEY